MSTQKIPAELLQKSKKILFITHLAIGDFSYLQNYFRAFSCLYPHLQIDLWVDELRRTSDSTQWPYLEKYSLYDWVEDCAFFNKVYRRTYSPDLFQQSLQEARNENYSIVVSLSILRPHRYADLARSVSPDGFVAGLKNRLNFFNLHHLLVYRKLDAIIVPNRHLAPSQHISDIYADWFTQLFGLETPAVDRFPYVTIPDQWLLHARQELLTWGIQSEKTKLVFINPFAKVKRRCWSLEKVAELVTTMQKQEAWRDACFIVNAPPERLLETSTMLSSQHLKNIHFFSAQDNFFQLPALLSICDLIISVETAVMHLANAVNVPVIALMRQKNPEWAPLDVINTQVIVTKHRRDWVDAIGVEEVAALLK